MLQKPLRLVQVQSSDQCQREPPLGFFVTCVRYTVLFPGQSAQQYLVSGGTAM